MFEVFLDGGWWLVDPTRLAPITGMVRIAHGRDAADIAFLTTAGTVRQTAMMISVVDLDAPSSTTPLDNAHYNPNTVEEAAAT